MFRTIGGTLVRAFHVCMLLFVLVPLSGTLVPGPAYAADGHVRCVDRSVSVSIDPSHPDDRSSRVYGELCATPSELRKGTTVQLLIHGGNYNHTYWDFGTIDGVSYNYARDVAARGFPTFTIDQIGFGQSSKPAGNQVTIEVAAFVDHQVVQGLKHSSITGVQFGKVIEMGHSFGSIATWEEAITYQDVAGVIITSNLHFISQTATTALEQDLYPANQDRKFANSGLPSGYFTTRPGTRAPLFYNTADADPNVIIADDNETPPVSFANERGKDVIPLGVFDGLGLLSSMATQAIHVPVLLIQGSNDFLFSCGQTHDCSSGSVLAQEEGQYYSPQAHLRACSVSSSGHDISLHLNHEVQVIDAIAWSYSFIGQGQNGNGHRGNWPPQGCSN